MNEYYAGKYSDERSTELFIRGTAMRNVEEWIESTYAVVSRSAIGEFVVADEENRASAVHLSEDHTGQIYLGIEDTIGGHASSVDFGQALSRRLDCHCVVHGVPFDTAILRGEILDFEPAMKNYYRAFIRKTEIEHGIAYLDQIDPESIGFTIESIRSFDDLLKRIHCAGVRVDAFAVRKDFVNLLFGIGLIAAGYACFGNSGARIIGYAEFSYLFPGKTNVMPECLTTQFMVLFSDNTIFLPLSGICGAIDDGDKTVEFAVSAVVTRGDHDA